MPSVRRKKRVPVGAEAGSKNVGRKPRDSGCRANRAAVTADLKVHLLGLVKAGEKIADSIEGAFDSRGFLDFALAMMEVSGQFSRLGAAGLGMRKRIFGRLSRDEVKTIEKKISELVRC